jgi:hypothetical protein
MGGIMENKTLPKEIFRTGVASFYNQTGPYYNSQLHGGTWNSTTVDKLTYDDHDTYKDVIKHCRFYFRHEPIAFSVITKMVNLAINGLVVLPKDNATFSKTEEQIFEAVSEDLIKFFRNAAFEYLTTGLVVPEIKLTRIRQRELRDKYIQRLESLLYPTDMWIRDSATVEIKKPFISNKESYFLIIPPEIIFFITSGGQYPDMTEDKALYKEILREYPEFVQQVRNGETKILLENPLTIKDTTLTDSQYPIPFLYDVLESFKHKRNLKRMDYSIAARVISAILHVRVGSDEYPLTEDQEDFLTDLEQKFKWRENITEDDVERVFTLFTNHTVALEWIFPQIEALLDDTKYDSVNRDILVGLGFPKILVTGETDRSFSSDPEIATLSPLNTLEVMRNQLLPIAKKVYSEMRAKNRVVNNLPEIKFKPINLMSLQLFYEGLNKLYEVGSISKQSLSEAYGYDFYTEVGKISEEMEVIKREGVPEFAPVPHSNTPDGGNKTNESKPKPKKTEPKPKESK